MDIPAQTVLWSFIFLGSGECQHARHPHYHQLPALLSLFLSAVPCSARSGYCLVEHVMKLRRGAARERKDGGDPGRHVPLPSP